MAKSKSKQSPADALSDLVAAAKAPTTAKGAAVASTSESAQAQPQPPQTVAEARARSQRGLELLTNVIKALEDASRTITTAGKHTRSAIDNTFKLSHAKLETAAENVKRSADSVASTNNRLAATIKGLGTLIQNFTGSVTGGVDPADLAEIKGQLTAIREELAKAPAPLEAPAPAPDLEAITGLLQPLKTTVEEALAAAKNESAQSTSQTARDVKEITRLVEGRTGKLTTLVFLSLACSIFAALCAFAGILTMLLKMVK
jgi:hypothetical protein